MKHKNKNIDIPAVKKVNTANANTYKFRFN